MREVNFTRADRRKTKNMSSLGTRPSTNSSPPLQKSDVHDDTDNETEDS